MKDTKTQWSPDISNFLPLDPSHKVKTDYGSKLTQVWIHPLTKYGHISIKGGSIREIKGHKFFKDAWDFIENAREQLEIEGDG